MQTLHQLVTWIDIVTETCKRALSELMQMFQLKKSSEKLERDVKLKFKLIQIFRKGDNVEIDRQIDLIENGQPVVQQTRLLIQIKTKQELCEAKKTPMIIVIFLTQICQN